MGTPITEQSLMQSFRVAQADVEYWTAQYRQTHSADDLIAAAQKWGIMCGLATAAAQYGYSDLQTELDKLTPQLYPAEYQTADKPF